MNHCKLSTTLVSLSLLFWPGLVQAQFEAFWDHVPGTNEAQTHPNTSLGNVPTGLTSVRSVNLKTISTGLPTPVTMLITNASLGSGAYVIADKESTNPAPGTPLFNTFYYPTNHDGHATNFSYVYFAKTTNLLGTCMQITNASVTFVFSGLTPRARYHFQGGAVRGGDTNSEYRRRYTRVEISGADSFVAKMSSNIVTSADTTDLAANQVAVNFGCNQTPDSGDMVDWDDIAPGADGTFSITCTRYNGAVPGGSSAGGRAYVFTGMRFEEKLGAVLSLNVVGSGTAVLSWSGTGTLEESNDLIHWQSSGVSNGASILLSGNKFYRLRE